MIGRVYDSGHYQGYFIINVYFMLIMATELAVRYSLNSFSVAPIKL
jgi:hypothetical protein